MSPSICERVTDACQFIQHDRLVIEAYPLQVYHFALIFSPNNSITRQSYLVEWPKYLAKEPKLKRQWSSLSRTLKTLDKDVSPKSPIAWSEDGVWLASWSSDSKVLVWDSKTGEILSILQGHESQPEILVFSRDRKRLAASDSQAQITIWDVSRGELVLNMRDPECYPDVLALSSDGNDLATAGFDGIRIWDISNGNPSLNTKVNTLLENHWEPSVGTRSPESFESRVKALAWSPKGALVASGWTNGSIKVWHKINSRYTSKLELGSHWDSIDGLSWSPQGNYLASTSFGAVKIFEVCTATCVYAVSKSAYDILIWTEDEEWSLIFPTMDIIPHYEALIDWFSSSDEFSQLDEFPVMKFAYSSTGLCAYLKDESIVIQDERLDPSNMADEVLRFATDEIIESEEVYVKWSPSGNLFVSASSHSIRIWNTEGCISRKIAQGNTGYNVWFIKWSSDEGWLSLGKHSLSLNTAVVEMWRPFSTEQMPDPYQGKPVNVHGESPAWSADGLWLATKLHCRNFLYKSLSPDNGQIATCDVANNRWSFHQTATNDIGDLAWSPVGSQLAWSTASAIYICEPVSGEINRWISVLPFDPKYRVCELIESIIWSSSGHLLAAAFPIGFDDSDQLGIIWDTRTNEIVACFRIRACEIFHFEDTDGCKLYTDVGVFDLKPAFAAYVESRTHVELHPHTEYALNSDRSWLTFQGEKILFIPEEYQGAKPSLNCTASRTMLALTLFEAHVLILHLQK